MIKLRQPLIFPMLLTLFDALISTLSFYIPETIRVDSQLGSLQRKAIIRSICWSIL